jgi:Ca2+-binding RTX toxin-like protein
MRKLVLTSLAVLAALVPVGSASATGTPRLEEPPAEQSYNVVLAGDNSNNSISIAVSADGRSYEIESSSPLEVGGGICTHPEGRANRLLCEATAIAGFEVNGNGGDDSITLSAALPVAATLRGGAGNDHLCGGNAADKLIGGSGNDNLIGRGGNDSLFGGSGDDELFGGLGDDHLYGGTGTDALAGGSGANELVQ